MYRLPGFPVLRILYKMVIVVECPGRTLYPRNVQKINKKFTIYLLLAHALGIPCLLHS